MSIVTVEAHRRGFEPLELGFCGTRATRASKRDVRRSRDNFWLKGYSFVMKSMFKVYFIDNEQAPREGRYSTEYVECNCRCGSPLASFFFFKVFLRERESERESARESES